MAASWKELDEEKSLLSVLRRFEMSVSVSLQEGSVHSSFEPTYCRIYSCLLQSFYQWGLSYACAAWMKWLHVY